MSERDELLEAWRSLGGQHIRNGWHTISISAGNACRLRAGRFYPEDVEALLIGFKRGTVLPQPELLPKGRGFDICPVSAEENGLEEQWIALRRQPEGSLELFTLMSVDLISTLSSFREIEDRTVLRAFLLRVRAWQEFMRRDSNDVLSPQDEVGLIGELEMIQILLGAGISASICVNGWTGPEDGLHDFQIGSGSIEVKSTISVGEFPVTISSLSQLDTALVKPLFLTGVRLSLDQIGTTLTERVFDIRDAISEDAFALSLFNSRLLHAGYFDEKSDHYQRRFLLTDHRILKISDSFPRITRSTVPVAIREVQYQLDLDYVKEPPFELAAMISELGAM